MLSSYLAELNAVCCVMDSSLHTSILLGVEAAADRISN